MKSKLNVVAMGPTKPFCRMCQKQVDRVAVFTPSGDMTEEFVTIQVCPQCLGDGIAALEEERRMNGKED